MIIFYITCKDKKEAEAISRHLLSSKLVACTNSFPITSMYFWNNKLETGKEHVLLAKTLKTKAELVEKEVKTIHSYECPCIIQIEANANEEFTNYLKKSLN